MHAGGKPCLPRGFCCHGSNAPDRERRLSPTLANIKKRMSCGCAIGELAADFVSRSGQSADRLFFSLELCEAIVDEIGVEVDAPT